MDDTISRQAAIDAANRTDYRGLTVEDVKKVTDAVVEELKALPSAQPEQHPITEDDYAYCAECDHGEMCRWYPMYGCEFKSRPTAERKGYWQITEAYPHNVYCSKCHTKYAQTHWAVWEDGSLPRIYCPNCGAKMGAEE